MTAGAVDETGQEKAGAATAGVKRQYMGCAGRVANGINTVHLCYVRERTGHALIGTRQWIPREHVEDPVKSLVTGLVPQTHTAGTRQRNCPGQVTKCGCLTTPTRRHGNELQLPYQSTIRAYRRNTRSEPDSTSELALTSA